VESSKSQERKIIADKKGTSGTEKKGKIHGASGFSDGKKSKERDRK